jgi:pimeloyl-ACP methyl ester carboxylesterase
MSAWGAQAQQAVTLTTRPGVTQQVLFTAVPNPAASVLLFPGGVGVLRMVTNNFLVRTAPSFAALGVNVAVVDAPSDWQSGMTDSFRMSAEQATDVDAVITFMRQHASVPIWLIGTSRGTVSAASAAARLGPSRVAGLVLTSTVWRQGIPQVPLEQIRVPTLVVHNRDDGCSESPFGMVDAGMERLRAAPVKTLIVVSGGRSRSQPCEALSPHGYYGIEDQVVPPVVAWIKAH